LFLYVEPGLSFMPALMAWVSPGTAWFHHQLIPSSTTTPVSASLDPRSLMAVGQLVNVYLLLGLISSLLFRAVRDALPNDLVAQERIVGAQLMALLIADYTHIIVTALYLPKDMLYDISAWNATTHGNITFVVLLISTRTAWFMGIGRTRHYYGQPAAKAKRG